MDDANPDNRTEPAPRRIRHDLDLAVVAAAGGDGARLTTGRLVAWTDGRWALTLPVAGVPMEVRGDREEGGRAAAVLLLRAGAGLGG